jgi:hypothetical protein
MYCHEGLNTEMKKNGEKYHGPQLLITHNYYYYWYSDHLVWLPGTLGLQLVHLLRGKEIKIMCVVKGLWLAKYPHSDVCAQCQEKLLSVNN